jgi:hypothetical protein
MPVRHSVVNEPRKYRSRQMGLCSLKSTGPESETICGKHYGASGGSPGTADFVLFNGPWQCERGASSVLTPSSPRLPQQHRHHPCFRRPRLPPPRQALPGK